MLQRCRDPNASFYKDYGGRGIEVCKPWWEFVAFQKWATTSGYRDDLEIDRADTNGHYEPANCRWVTDTQQARNTRRTLFVDVNGERLSLPDAAERYGVSPRAAYARIVKLGWSVDAALKTPIRGAKTP